MTHWIHNDARTSHDELSSEPAANRLLDKLRILMTLAVDEGWRKDNPTIGVRGCRNARLTD